MRFSLAFSRRAFLSFLFAAVSLSLGCAARRPVGSYRLARSFLLPPDFSAPPNGALSSRISLGNLGGGRARAAASSCSIEGRLFSLEHHRQGKSADWVAEVPTPAAWYRGAAVHAQSDWSAFLDRLYRLQARGCLTPKAYLKAADWTAESIPTPVLLATFFRYLLGNRGFVALRPGMRLFIERSIFHNSLGPETVANYWGERKTYYRVVRGRGGLLSLDLRRVWRSKGLPSRAGAEFPDTSLAGHFHGMRALDLFVLTLYVPPNVRRKALLVATRDPGEMAGVTHAVEKNLEIPCRQLATSVVRCAMFAGMVSASAELNVRVNGKRQYFPIGTTIQTLLNTLTPDERSKALRTLRIERRFRGRLYPVEFRLGSPSVPQLALVAGDRIRWSH